MNYVAVNKKVMKDPRLADMMQGTKEMPFDVKRMVYGGFKVIVDEWCNRSATRGYSQ